MSAPKSSANHHLWLPYALGVVVLLLPFVTATSFKYVMYGANQIFVSIYGALSLSAIVLVIQLFMSRSSKCLHVHLTSIDIAVGLYFLTGALNIAAVNAFLIDPIIWLKWIAIMLFYILTRVAVKPAVISWAVVISAVVQAVITLLQKAGFVESNHILFDVTGTFGNPGPLGGYLAVGSIICFGLLNQEKHCWAKSSILILLIPILAALFFTSSRAALLATFTGVLYWGICRIKVSARMRHILIIAMSAVVVTSAALLFVIRPASALSRLLVWRVSHEMVCDAPLLGHGIGSFPLKYMSYQANYLCSNPNSRFVSVADNPNYAYNEVVHIAVEQGAIGVIAFLILAGLIVFSRPSLSPGSLKEEGRRKTLIETSIRAGIICFLVFAMFSYPSSVFPLLMLLPILAGSVSAKTVAIISLRNFTVWAGICSLILLVGGTVYMDSKCRKASEFLTSPPHPWNRQNIEEYDTDLAFLGANMDYRTMYIRMVVRRMEFSEALVKRISPLIDNYDIGLEFGEFLHKNSKLELAQQYYKQALCMIPSRMKPNYMLWKLAIEKGDFKSAIYYARVISKQQVKVSNTFTIRTRYEMVQFLEKMEGYDYSNLDI